jgi:ribosomal protein S1
VIVEVPGGIEGFIPTSKLTTENLRNLAEAFKPGDTPPRSSSRMRPRAS